MRTAGPPSIVGVSPAWPGARASVVPTDAPVSRPSIEAPAEEATGAPWHRIVRFVLLACLLSGLYALGALLPFWFLDTPVDGAAFFPAAGLTVSVLLLSPPRRWPWWLLLFGATEIAV